VESEEDDLGESVNADDELDEEDVGDEEGEDE
jgi:hypothetical protein